MSMFIATITALCGLGPNVDELKYEDCIIKYTNCAVGKAGEYDMIKLEQCSVEYGDNFTSAKLKAKKEVELN